jgi:hypothetical protein
MIGGLAGHGKTWVMLAMVRALLEGGKLFHYFPGPLRTRLFASIRQTSYVFSGPSVLITTDLTSIPDWVMYTTYIEITIYRWPESGWKIVPGFLVRGPSGLFPIFDLLGTRTFLYSTSYVHGAGLHNRRILDENICTAIPLVHFCRCVRRFGLNASARVWITDVTIISPAQVNCRRQVDNTGVATTHVTSVTFRRVSSG